MNILWSEAVIMSKLLGIPTRVYAHVLVYQIRVQHVREMLRIAVEDIWNTIRAEKGRDASEPSFTINGIAEVLLAYFISANYILTRKGLRGLVLPAACVQLVYTIGYDDDRHDHYVVVLIVSFLWCPILAKGAGEGYREIGSHARPLMVWR